MLIVFPVSAADYTLVPPMLKILERLGPNGQHDALVVATPTAVASGQQLLAGIKGLFASSEIRVLNSEPAGGWPTACNIHFRETARIVYEEYMSQPKPWYWFELDNTPLRRNWVDLLQHEYNVAGLPFMGKVHPTHFVQSRDENDEPLEFAEQDKHMVGTGIYPHDLWKRSILLHYMVQPFDVEMQYEIVPNCHDTDLIQHNWSSGKYTKIRGGAIVCKSLHPGRSPVDHARPVSKSTVVLHGCKDGTLVDVMLRKRNIE